MKRIHITILMYFCFSNLLLAQGGYTIKGHIDGLTDNSKIYLIDGGRRETIDSAVVRNETFILKGNITSGARL